MDTLPRELMIRIISFLDYRSMCRLYQCNKIWCDLLLKEETWELLISDHYQLSKPLPNMTYWESYELLFFSNGNVCKFCSAPAVKILCLACFDKAWEIVQEYYDTDDVAVMVKLSKFEGDGCERDGYEGDAMTFRYASSEHEKNADITDAEFIIDEFGCVIGMCCSNRDPLFSGKFIDLSMGKKSGFWIQSGLE